MASYTIGLDYGTNSVRAIIVDTRMERFADRRYMPTRMVTWE